MLLRLSVTVNVYVCKDIASMYIVVCVRVYVCVCVCVCVHVACVCLCVCVCVFKGLPIEELTGNVS